MHRDAGRNRCGNRDKIAKKRAFMKEIHRQILAGCAGGLVLAGMVFLGDFIFLFSLLASAGSGLGAYLLIPRKKEDHEIEMAPGVTRADYNQAISGIDETICRFERLAKMSGQKNTDKMIQDIVQSLKNIKELFIGDPGDIGRTGAFLARYMPRAHDIAKQYVWLSSMPLKDGDRQVLQTARSAMERIRDGFSAIYRQCLKNDLTELEVNSELLREIMELDLPTLDLPERRSS